MSFLLYYYCTEKVFLLSKTKKSKILPSQFSWWFSNSLAVIYFFHTKRKWNVYVRNTKRLMMIERNTKCSVNFFWKKKDFLLWVDGWLTVSFGGDKLHLNASMHFEGDQLVVKYLHSFTKEYRVMRFATNRHKNT